jgi:hypothetical protein
MPSAKVSGVELGVGRGEGEVLAVGDPAEVGVTAGVMVAGAEGGVTVDAGVEIAVWGDDVCRWHWQSKKAAAPRTPALTKCRETQPTTSAIDLWRTFGRVESFLLLFWIGLVSRKAE